MARTRKHPDEPAQAAPSVFSGAVAIGVGVLIALAIVAVMLYGPLCDWYAAWRNNLRLQTSYAEILDEHAELQEDVDHLRTREGIEDEARKQGLVGEGETRVVVENLGDDTVTADEAPAEAPEDPWYLLFLDAIFGFKG